MGDRLGTPGAVGFLVFAVKVFCVVALLMRCCHVSSRRKRPMWQEPERLVERIVWPAVARRRGQTAPEDSWIDTQHSTGKLICSCEVSS